VAFLSLLAAHVNAGSVSTADAASVRLGSLISSTKRMADVELARVHGKLQRFLVEHPPEV